MKPLMIFGVATFLLIVWVSWMFRYDVPTHLEAVGTKVPIILDRWTGNTYLYSGGKWDKIETRVWEEVTPAKK